ncbi:MAG: lysostaphin resistance A-like protein [Microcoleaceae cyanobacterium]
MMISWLIHGPAVIKVALFFCIWVGVWLPVAMISVIALRWHPPQPLNTTQKLILMASLYLIVPIVLWQFVQAEGLQFNGFGILTDRKTWVAVGVGFSLAILSLSVSLGIQLKSGWVSWQPQGHQLQDSAVAESAVKAVAPEESFTMQGSRLLRQLLPVILLALWISSTEEIVFRGLVQIVLQQDYSPWDAAILGSAVFAFTHLVWQPQSAWPQIPGLWLLGMVLTLACFTQAGTLGLAIGLHGGWIFGLSGLDTVGTLSPTDQVPRWVTGGSSRPLTGLVDGLMLGAIAVLLRIVDYGLNRLFLNL